MTKVVRYFNKSEDETEPKTKKQRKRAEEQQKKATNEIITYNVKLKKKFTKPTKPSTKKVPNPNPKFPGRKPIDPKLLEKHSRGAGISKSGVKTRVHRKRIAQKEEKLKYAHEQAARVEVLLTEQTGLLEADDGETTTQFTQQQIAENVDISAASKSFELKLNDFGPYRMKYTRNGRHLLLGGKKGHVAAFDWMTKKLHCEMNVMETVHDISWLHLETMFAVAQKDWVYVYDNQGIELHCVKRLNRVNRMEFLPYHFLLATASDEGFLAWLDISIGQIVSRFNSNLGPVSIMTQNPANAVLCVGDAKGVVSMWSPNCHKPLLKMLCHKSALTAVHVDPKGVYMATGAMNNEVRIWDVRKLEYPLQDYKLYSAASQIQFSQKNLMALAMGNIVEVYRDCCTQTAKRPYLRHRFNQQVGNMNFCPFEDVLGVATAKGFTSLLVPGAGEANFDALELNPFQTKSQRREYEVKALLEKIQPELITLDPALIADVDVPTLQDKVEMKQKLAFLKPPKINYEPRNKMKGKGGTANLARNKKIVQAEAKKAFVKSMKGLREDGAAQKKKKKQKTDSMAQSSVLDRFLPK